MHPYETVPGLTFMRHVSNSTFGVALLETVLLVQGHDERQLVESTLRCGLVALLHALDLACQRTVLKIVKLLDKLTVFILEEILEHSLRVFKRAI